MISIGRESFQATDVLHLILLQTNIGNSLTGFGHNIVPIVGPMWTISVEFQFYLILPFIFDFISKKGLSYVLGLTIFIILIKAMTYISTGAGYWVYFHTILGRFDQFLIGIIFAKLYLNKWFLIKSFYFKNIYCIVLRAREVFNYTTSKNASIKLN